MSNLLELTVKAPKMIRVGDADFRLSFPLRVTAQLEEALGRDLKFVSDWFRIKTQEVRTFLYFGLLTYQDESVAARVADQIVEALDPEDIEHVINALCVAAFPKAMARVEEEYRKSRQRQLEGKPPVPNGESVAAS